MKNPPHRVLLAAALLLTATATAPSQDQKPVPPDVLQLATACNQFAADLHQQLAAGGAPTAGPGSIAIALLMLVPGARDTTADELHTVLHLPPELRGERLQSAAQQLLADCVGEPADDSALRLANAMWAQQGHRFVDAYVSTLRQAFGARHHLVDFKNHTEAARQTINAEVEKQTNDRIKELIPRDLLSPDSRLVLTNAMWFKAAWRHAFSAHATKLEPFTRSDGSKVDVQMMHVSAALRCADDEAWRAVELPFQDSSVVCELVVPRDGHSLEAAEKALLADRLRPAFANQQLHLAMPRFRVAAAPALAKPLQAMGMRTAFTNQANFGGIDANEPLCISEVLHQTWIQVDETGAEAAAATAVILKRAGARSRLELRLDRTFAFALRESRTGLLLFVGRVEDPSVAPQ